MTPQEARLIMTKDGYVARYWKVLTGRVKRLSSVLAVLCILAISSGRVLAQATTGTILGTVTDPSGATVPNAMVTIRNTDRNAVVRTVKTNGIGEYTAPQLPIGHYSVNVEAPNFKSSTTSNLTLNVNDNLHVKAILEVGS